MGCFVILAADLIQIEENVKNCEDEKKLKSIFILFFYFIFFACWRTWVVPWQSINLIKSNIEKLDTHNCEQVFQHQNDLCLCDHFRSLQYLFRILQTTILRIVPEVLDAIFKVFVDDFCKGWSCKMLSQK